MTIFITKKAKKDCKKTSEIDIIKDFLKEKVYNITKITKKVQNKKGEINIVNYLMKKGI